MYYCSALFKVQNIEFAFFFLMDEEVLRKYTYPGFHALHFPELP